MLSTDISKFSALAPLVTLAFRVGSYTPAPRGDIFSRLLVLIVPHCLLAPLVALCTLVQLVTHGPLVPIDSQCSALAHCSGRLPRADIFVRLPLAASYTPAPRGDKFSRLLVSIVPHCLLAPLVAHFTLVQLVTHGPLVPIDS